MNKKNNDEDSDIKKENIIIGVGEADALSPQDKALLKYGEDVLVKSADTLKDFSKTMITLMAALFASYFALLRFIVTAEINSIDSQSINISSGIPPALFVFGIISFVFAIMPSTGKLSINNLDDIKKLRNSSIRRKKIAVTIGVIFLVIGMFSMLVIYLHLLMK